MKIKNDQNLEWTQDNIEKVAESVEIAGLQPAQFLKDVRPALPAPLNVRELATVLAALRYWQNYLDEDPREKMPEHFHDHEPLTAEEIDDLCARLR